jgi:membrane-associated phospholipid phosphatase
MPVIASLIGATVGALVVVLAAEALGRGSVVGDTEGTERWLVDRIDRLPGVRRVIAVADRYVWGGAMVALGWIAVTATAAAVGWIFSTIDDDSGFARFDESVAQWGSDAATASSSEVLRGVTWLGDTWLLLTVMSIVGITAVVRFPGRPWSVIAFLLTVGTGVSVVNNTLKWVVMRDRPVVDHLVGSGGSSFPSGHTAAAAACWAAMAIVVARRMRTGHRRWAMALAVAIAVMVAASRVMLGVHWLTDVIAGLLVGWTWCFLVALAFGGRIQRFGEPAERVRAADAAATVRASCAHRAGAGSRPSNDVGVPS